MERFIHVSWFLIVVAGVTAAQGAVRLSTRRVNVHAFMAMIQKLLHMGDIARAIKLCSAADQAALPLVVKRVLMRANRLPLEDEPLRATLTTLLDEEREVVESDLVALRFYPWAALVLAALAALYDLAWAVRAGVAFHVVTALTVGLSLVTFGQHLAALGEIQRGLVTFFELIVKTRANLAAMAAAAPPPPPPPPAESQPFRTPAPPPPPPALGPKYEPVFLAVYQGSRPSVTIRHATAPAALKVGRVETADLRLDDDPGVSRMHAMFERETDGSLRVLDLGSTEGTYVNEEKVVRASLRHGDIVRMGATRVVIGYGSAPPRIVEN
jgi:hypothetical protein